MSYAEREYLRALIAISDSRDGDPVTLEEVRKSIGVLPSSASRALGGLVKRGLIERYNNARGIFYATDAGRAAIA